MKKVLKITGVLLLVIIGAAAIFILTYQPKQYTDFGVFTNLRSLVLTYLKEYQATERPITADFKEFTLNAASGFSVGTPKM